MSILSYITMKILTRRSRGSAGSYTYPEYKGNELQRFSVLEYYGRENFRLRFERSDLYAKDN